MRHLVPVSFVRLNVKTAVPHCLVLSVLGPGTGPSPSRHSVHCIFPVTEGSKEPTIGPSAWKSHLHSSDLLQWRTANEGVVSFEAEHSEPGGLARNPHLKPLAHKQSVPSKTRLGTPKRMNLFSRPL